VISVLILTLNEELNLPECLASVAWSDDVVVLDSLSTDRTAAFATAAGARVVLRRFDNYANQRNHALREVTFRHAWVYMADADERVPSNLRDEMLARVAAAGPDVAAFRLRRKDMFMGRWLRRSTGYPTWATRLIRAGRVHVEREINEEVVVDGRVDYLDQHFLHYPFNRGFAHWIERHNRYSTMEAERLLVEREAPIDWPGLASRDPARRRKTLKRVAYRLPGRPFLAFCYLYLVRLGLLDGAAGWHYCRLRAVYEYMIDVKMTETRRRRQGLPV
jgi:glycosyltransferase involved in cell wall biosynthesis